ncbi:methionine gamma-lyase family protein [Petroclostridium sp. X23]|uniref:methionine gamma-lyase family protein n=1 Tax=Petroclostridium sp. X23 TaxID=3045146 RepID=UPI0024ACBA1D|nr:methionine gamma-lyase family protein [Petroclostridium sp. X23]WHH59511.1 methionine gamma-lyase family protein [Petroclostridium sp. X23]
MKNKMIELLFNEFNISDQIYMLSQKVEEYISEKFEEIDQISQYNQYKVLKAFQNHHISDTHFVETTGYGYDDLGREALDAVYADVFRAEDALVRHNIISGTHALAICLFGILRPGDTLLAVTGKPYDTLEEVIGIRGQNNGSLKELGVNYQQIDLTLEGKVNLQEVKSAVNQNTKMALIQRSKGYDWRPSLSVTEIGEIIREIKKINPDTMCLVDNCYGEFVETIEPTEVGADLAAGSLIKNPGGGLAPTGGYIVGKKECVKLAAYRLTSPGIGKKCGASLGMNRQMFQGFFMAPHIVSQSLKAAIFCAAVFEKLGFDVCPAVNDIRTDIIQAVKFNNPELVISFCQGIQKGAPIDSFVEPQPWDMPGYESQVIMAAGAFIQGASIELSADAPIKPPYIAYMQGGLTWHHAKLGVMIALQNMVDKGLIDISL